MSGDQAARARRFRQLHERDELFVIANPFDVGSAKMLETMGFKALATSSAGHAFSAGLPDGYTTNQDVLEHCYLVSEAVEVPVSADLEMGFGDSPGEVAATIREAAPTGIVGCSIEDHTGRLGEPIYEFSLAVERIAAAVEAARGLPHDFVLTARSENFLHERPNLDDTIKRLVAFEEAGADVLYAPNLPDIAAVREVCQAVTKPVNVLAASRFDIPQLADAGVRRVSVGSGFARIAYGAMIKAAREVCDDGTLSYVDEAIGFAEIERMLK